MRKLAPARVSYWDDFLVSYCVSVMLGYFISRLFEGTLHVGKIHVRFKIMRTRSSPPVDQFYHETGGRFAFT